MASEVGVLDIAPENVAHKGRLQPGRMFLVDTEQGRIVDDDEIKEAMAARKPYRAVARSRTSTHLSDLPAPADVPPAYSTRHARSRASRRSATRSRTSRILMAPMALNGAGGRRLDGHRHAARGAVRPAAARCSATSSSSSRRSPTRRSIRSARSS